MTDQLPADAALALANAHLLAVAPGRITSITVDATTIRVESSLASPFADKSDSRWLTVLDRVDGHTISCDVTAQSEQLRCEACGYPVSSPTATCTQCGPGLTQARLNQLDYAPCSGHRPGEPCIG